MSKPKEMNKNSYYTTYATRIVLNTASHPIEYAKVLIQIGFEPIAPKPCTTFLGKPALKLPNIFDYIRHIKKVDGFVGLYRGLVPKLCGNIVCAVASEKILKNYDGDCQNEHEDNEQTQVVDSKQKFISDLKREVISRTGSIIISHPFHVITIRMMAQFVGNETKYNGLFGSIHEVYKQNGVMGFFSGLVPRVIGDLIFVLLASTLTYALNSYVFEEAELQVYTSATMSFLASAITYPFQVVSNCMTVSNSGLAAGSMPFMPFYTSWADCWFDLSNRGQLKRGSSLLIRYYTGPQVIISGRPVPLPKGDSINLS
ncbi:PREDICTED: mitochondrial carrier homolog 2-like [Nicrophorus vespilloides]|uniref:Mitochondrial carrier homolog 2-like n=1 Tax=Nicrophorus vespilloides TaxID=110193 RepID=A0ABM1MGE3_NICVS|nr:PREDICTED: mitochondrial carrier homolog 2-like [Nicrophorus vespilloides]